MPMLKSWLWIPAYAGMNGLWLSTECKTHPYRLPNRPAGRHISTITITR
jgi:hypothetical protein